jgi:nucleoside-diphosphate-sugar epimerase
MDIQKVFVMGGAGHIGYYARKLLREHGLELSVSVEN